jgi:HupE / UreJ protein
MGHVRQPNAVRRPRLLAWLCALCLWLATSPAARAHETPIALLSLREVQPGTFVERWTYSSVTNSAIPTPIYPPHCKHEPPRVTCGERGLVGNVSIEKLGVRYSAAVVRIRHVDGRARSLTLTAAAPVATLTAEGELPLSQVARSYVPLGFEHILLGVDHLLFVLGLMLLVSTPWMLFKTITAFTAAHSITLAAATLGWVGVPERAVNAAIALSIVFVAVEVSRHRRGEPCLSARFPWAVAFGFGLLHGFGFAGALTAIGLPQDNLPAALLFFNVGVEVGQLGFVLGVLALVRAHRSLEAEPPPWSERWGVYGMGAIASFWFVSRFARLLAPLL